MSVGSKLVFGLLVGLLVAGCQTAPTRSGDTGASQQASAALPFPQPPVRMGELDEEVVFSALAGEIAAQEGENRQAYEYLLRAARLSGDPALAQRAAAVALASKDSHKALEAANLWVALAPNEISARQMLAMLQLRRQDEAAVLEQLRAIVQIARARDEDGFLHSMAAVTREQDRQAAMGVMARLREEFEDDPRSGYAAALTAVLARQYARAEQEASRLMERHPDWSKGYILMSRIAAAQDQRARSAGVLQQALERFPSDTDVRVAYARLLVELERPEDAYREFLWLSRKLPEDAEVRFSLGLISLQLDKPEQARPQFEKLVEMGKRSELASYYLGRIEEDAGNSEAAIEWYRQVERGRYSYEAQVRRARLLAQQGKLGVARSWLQNLRIQLPRRAVQLYLLEGELLQKHGAPGEVMEFYDQALSAHPDEVDLLYARALFAASQGRVDILERDLLKVLASQPDHADALNALGYTLADQTGRYQEALGYIQKALELKPESPAILDSMGWVHYRLGNNQLALEYLRKAMQLLPDPEIAAHLGEVLWVNGEHEEARSVWQGALERSPESKFVRESMKRFGLK